jgi:hypothetical protein
MATAEANLPSGWFSASTITHFLLAVLLFTNTVL